MCPKPHAKPYHQLSLISEHRPTIQAFIQKNCTIEQRNSLATLYKMIDGFESPLGMELLATIDVLVTENKELLANAVPMQQQVEKWNERKARLMKSPYVVSTTERLKTFEKVLYASEAV